MKTATRLLLLSGVLALCSVSCVCWKIGREVPIIEVAPSLTERFSSVVPVFEFTGDRGQAFAALLPGTGIVMDEELFVHEVNLDAQKTSIGRIIDQALTGQSMTSDPWGRIVYVSDRAAALHAQQLSKKLSGLTNTLWLTQTSLCHPANRFHINTLLHLIDPMTQEGVTADSAKGVKLISNVPDDNQAGIVGMVQAREIPLRSALWALLATTDLVADVDGQTVRILLPSKQLRNEQR